MDELNQSSFNRAWADTKKSFHSIIFFWGVEVVSMVVCGYLATVLIPESANRFVSAGYPAVGAIIGAVIGFGIIYSVMLVEAPYKQRNEARRLLMSIPGATLNSPRIASPELFFEHIDIKFIGDNPPLLRIIFDVMPTGSMYLEQAKIEILDRTILFDNWQTETVSPSIIFGFDNQCEITGKLPSGNHDIRILIYANKGWWTSGWETVNYDPSVLDKEGSQTE